MIKHLSYLAGAVSLTISALCAADPSYDSDISEATVGMEHYSRYANVLGLTSRWPSAVVYNRSGHCVFRGELDRSWDLRRFKAHSAMTEAQSGCDLIVASEMGGDQPAASDKTTIQLYVLDAPFCSECIRIEGEVRKLVAEEPGNWQVMLTRVNLSESHNPIVTDDPCETCQESAGRD